jgi:UDP-N-acetylglucosamine--N-acetylmuramyl-(pentapeptide) pyrophosphoryl-undecaprenol N-acetylglucosamine transferase
MKKTLLVMSGGSGGHIYPALAVARLLLDKGVNIVWLGTRTGLESRIVFSEGIDLEWIEVKGLRGVGWVRWFSSAVMLVRAFWQATCVIRRRRPDALLGMGSYVSGPGALVGLLMRLPLVIHEANSQAGFTNQVLARFATRVLTGFPVTYGLGRKTEWVGNPVRTAITKIDTKKYCTDKKKEDFQLLVTGGSQGAEILNRLVPSAVAMLAVSDRPIIVHQCGQAWKDVTEQRYSELGVDADVVGYIENIGTAYQNSDLVICRSGAMTLAEISSVGVASLLVPFPHAVGDHQSKNAMFMVERGAACLIPQELLSSQTLANLMFELLNDRSKLTALARAARALSCPDAAERVAACCLEAMGA